MAEITEISSTPDPRFDRASDERPETSRRPSAPPRGSSQLETLGRSPPPPRTGTLEITVDEGSSSLVGPSSSRATWGSDVMGSLSRALGTSSRRSNDPISNLQLLGRSDRLSDSFHAVDILTPPDRRDAVVAQGPLQAGFPTTIAEWQMAVHQERNRKVEPELVASVLNDVRGVGTTNVGESHGDAMRRITPENVRDWRKGIGLTDRDVAVIEHNSRTIGRFIPSSSTLFNLVNYGLVPWLPNMGSKDSKTNAFISIGIAGMLQPLVTSLVQTPIVAALDTWRKKMGPAITLDKGVHARITPQAAGAELKQAVGELKGVQRDIENFFREMATAYGVPVGEGPLAQAEVEAVVQHLNTDTEHERQAAFMTRLGELGQQSLEAEGDVRVKSDQVRMSTGVQDRQWQSTTHQLAPRIARAASSYVTPIGRAIERAHHQDPTTWTTLAAVGAAAMSMAWQHYAAGEDEVHGAASVEEKLNMLYGTDYLKPEGLEVLRHGGEFRPEHLDADKLRGLAPGPATQMLDRVRVTLEGFRNSLSPTSPQDAPKIAEYERDLEAIKHNDLQNLTPNGDAERLMQEVIGRGGDKHPFTFAAREGWNKLTKLEITAQIGQRMGVAWMLGALGNVGATAGGRLLTALNGGSSHAPLKVQFGASTLSTAMGVTSALTNYMPVNVKNERRADPEQVSFGRQLWNSVTAPVWQGRQHLAAKASTSAAGETAATKPASAEAVRPPRDEPPGP